MAGETVIEEIRSRGGSVYVWPCKRCCGGTISLDASIRPPDGEFELVTAEPLQVFARPGMRLPRELHLELDRKSRVRAYWDGLVWMV